MSIALDIKQPTVYSRVTDVVMEIEMSEQKHTPEPWVYEAGIDNYRNVDMGDVAGSIMAGGFHIARAWLDLPENGHDNARRIVACVNACAGIDTATLEAFGVEVRRDLKFINCKPMGEDDYGIVIENKFDGITVQIDTDIRDRQCVVELAKTLVGVKTQRDQLLEALKEIASTNASKHGTTGLMMGRCMEIASRAIAAAEG